METTTQNSGALSELRPEKFPAPDADFFRAFVPEILFALVVWIVVAIAYAYYSKLIEKIPDERAGTPQKTTTAADKAAKLVEALDLEDAEYAAKVWAIVRNYLSEEYGNPFFPNMTASEAVNAAKHLTELSGLAMFAREIEYSAYVQNTDNHEKVRNASIAFLQRK